MPLHVISRLLARCLLRLACLYEPLHHKYRPQTFAQLVGQGAIASTLTHALQQNRIAPAYLFCGPRGTGKTSSARILAKSLNCLESDTPTAEPCGKCDVCLSVNRGNALDIVEIDAASNTGVDNIRELIERAQFAPVQCRYKAYVVDECHMLSTAAFNALLKTLEEPPDRVVFVLATTDPQRVLPTIISRCQRFDFRRIPLPAMIKHLSYIAEQESIQIAEPAIQLVAQISQGGLRDAESLLDQLSLQAEEIVVESVWDLVGAVPERDLLNLVRAIAADDGTALIERVRNLMDKGREPLIVLQSLVGFYRDLLIAKSAPARADMVAITPPTWAEMTEFSQQLSVAQLLASQQRLQTAEVQVKNTTQPRLWLEITLTGLLPSALGAVAQLSANGAGDRSVKSVLSIANPPTISTTPNAIPPIQAPAAEAPPAEKAPPEPPEVPVAPAVAPPLPEPAEAPEPEPPAEVAFGNLAELWAKILAALAPRGTQMLMNQQGVLLGFDGVGAKVGFRSASLQKMAQERVPNLEAAFASVFQRPIKVFLEVVEPEKGPEKKTDATAGHPQPSSGTRPTPPPPKPDSRPSSPPKQTSSRLPSDTPSQNTTPNSPPSAGSPPNAQPLSAPEDRSYQPPSNPSLPSNGTPDNNWAANQEQDNIKRFAQFFNGQIVNLDDEDTDQAPSQKSSDPGPDVPF